MTDEDFVAAFEACLLPAEAFRHRDHLRLAWVYLQRASWEEAVGMIERSIRKFAAHHGATSKYHHTITLFWMHLVAVATAQSRNRDFDSFLAAQPQLLDKALLGQFYSTARLSDPAARSGWLAPDLRPLPIEQTPLKA
jgi:hypothetical protein